MERRIMDGEMVVEAAIVATAQARLDQLLAEPLPSGFEPGDIVMRRFLLDCKDKVRRADVEKHQQLRTALRVAVTEMYGDCIQQMVEHTADSLYLRLQEQKT